MILYSIVPPEVVFKGFSEQPEQGYFEAGYRGEKVVVSQMRGGNYQIARLLSTRPGAFLDPAFQPGMAVLESELKINKKSTE